MDYKHEQNIDNEFTAAWVLKLINRATGRVPRPADDFPTPTFIFSQSSRPSIPVGDDPGLGAIKIDQTGTHSGAYGDITPAPDGSVTEFFVEQTFVSGKCEVYKNGKGLIQGMAEDWIEGTGLISVVITPAPIGSDILTTAYEMEFSEGILIEHQTGTTGDSYQKINEITNGARTTFTLKTGAFIATTMRLYKNGKLQIEGAGNDFTMNGDAGSFTFNGAPLGVDVLAASAQQKPLPQIDQSGGTADTYGTLTEVAP